MATQESVKDRISKLETGGQSVPGMPESPGPIIRRSPTPTRETTAGASPPMVLIRNHRGEVLVSSTSPPSKAPSPVMPLSNERPPDGRLETPSKADGRNLPAIGRLLPPDEIPPSQPTDLTHPPAPILPPPLPPAPPTSPPPPLPSAPPSTPPKLSPLAVLPPSTPPKSAQALFATTPTSPLSPGSPDPAKVRNATQFE